MNNVTKLLAGLGLAAALLAPASAAWDSDKGCLTCHEGIERFADTKVMSKLSCTKCHNGDGKATEFDSAHADLWANPTDLRVVDNTCGKCHSKDVKNAKTSIHATMSGMISGTRYDFGSQSRDSIHATYDVKALKTGREGTVESLSQIPSYDPTKAESDTNSIGDDYLRNQCLRCHIWSDGHQRDGDYRGSGCAACHVEYSNDATYQGGDKAIDKTQKDRPIKHKITRAPSVDQCQHCHNRGSRIGVSYKGMMESDGYGTPYKDNGGKQGKLHGKHYNFLQADLHYDAGLSCIDCHTKNEMHGDGYLYEKKEHAVEIRCATCHGTTTTPATLKTTHGDKMNNLERNGDQVIINLKGQDKSLEVPQLMPMKQQSNGELTPMPLALSPAGKVAMMDIPVHMEKLECHTCHSGWAPQCYGCHAKQDISKPNGDWLSGKSDDLSKQSNKANRDKTAFAWQESRSYVRWDSAGLGINHRGKVSTYVPGCQVFLTQVDGDKPIISNKAYTTKDGTSGIAHNPIVPHTTSKQARTCTDCHTNPKVWGVGSGIYKVERNFPAGEAPIDFELERFVDESGKQLQATNHKGARPFNKAEQDKIKRVGTCIACHASEAKKMGQAAPNDITHSKLIREQMNK
ncbi:multiheme c-type cytochrome [uncultured Ferrimonas sp.]|uniref:multiheme c-type cytochrome n=1 Tax=uncultured Ferrimonas sp. TaxID=432640 RepID=UPI002616FEC9|nr:multiheme c-type cytochrome [uncultured Ferrimonas sp.]